jgi:hypothetical protein
MQIEQSTQTAERPSLTDLAHVLFASPLQEFDHPTSAQVREAVDRVLLACGGDCATCAGCVAQEAGDHPEQYLQRMRWARVAVRQAYHPTLPLAS